LSNVFSVRAKDRFVFWVVDDSDVVRGEVSSIVLEVLVVDDSDDWDVGNNRGSVYCFDGDLVFVDDMDTGVKVT
jgi:hypothetical protein